MRHTFKDKPLYEMVSYKNMCFGVMISLCLSSSGQIGLVVTHVEFPGGRGVQ